MTIFENAIDWVARGVAVIPLGYMQKTPVVPWEAYKTRLPEPGELWRWFSGGNRNYGVVTGWCNLVVIDFDNLDVYMAWRALWPDFSTFEVITARGVHVYVFTRQPTRALHLRGMLDVQAGGAYVVGPGSIHPSGAVYQEIQDVSIMTVDRIEDILPPGLFDQEQPPVPVVPVKLNLPRKPVDPWDVFMQDPAPNVITAIKRRFTPLDLLPDAKRTSSDGRWWMTVCPFHADQNPSFWIDTSRGLCGCYAGCTSKPLDVINLYARLFGCDNRAAIMALSRKL